MDKTVRGGALGKEHQLIFTSIMLKIAEAQLEVEAV